MRLIMAGIFAVAIALPASAVTNDEAQSAYKKGEFAAAAQMFRELSDNGDLDAKFRLGLMYAKGEGVQKDFSKSVSLISEAADANNVDALMFLASVSLDKRPREAFDYWMRAAELGAPFAQANVGRYFQTGADGVAADAQKAIHWYEKAADAGDSGAMSSLGAIYRAGEGVPVSFKEALYWLNRAEKLSDPDAQSLLALMYINGEGVPQDFQKAFSLSLAAAEQGDVFSQLRVGSLLFVGQGAPRNLVESHKWINLGLSALPASSSEQRKKASELLGLISEKMTKLQVAEAQRLAREWLEKRQVSRSGVSADVGKAAKPSSRAVKGK